MELPFQLFFLFVQYVESLSIIFPATELQYKQDSINFYKNYSLKKYVFIKMLGQKFLNGNL